MLAQTVLEYCSSRNVDHLKIIPLTFLVRGDKLEQEIEDIIRYKYTEEGGFDIPLIVKPGEFSNRGNGISMAFTAQQLRDEAASIIETRQSTDWVIVQNYLTKPLLYKSRKFDIRCYALVVKTFNKVDYFWYNTGYARTSSFEY